MDCENGLIIETIFHQKYHSAVGYKLREKKGKAFEQYC